MRNLDGGAEGISSYFGGSLCDKEGVGRCGVSVADGSPVPASCSPWLGCDDNREWVGSRVSASLRIELYLEVLLLFWGAGGDESSSEPSGAFCRVGVVWEAIVASFTQGTQGDSGQRVM